MSTTPATRTVLMTAEEFSRRPDPGYPEELVRGKIVPLAIPHPRHGQICTKVILILGNYIEAHDLGHVISNCSAVITERSPDTVRGADIAFYTHVAFAQSPLPCVALRPPGRN